MSLRIRLIASIVVALLVSLLVGGMAAGWHAVRSVRMEMQAALAVGVQTLRDRLDGASDDAELVRLVRVFDGDRHVRAVLRDAAGTLRLASQLRSSASGAPAWFVASLAPSLAPEAFDLGRAGTVSIETDPRNEIGEVWTQLQDDLVAVGLFCGLSIVLVNLLVRRALRPLDELAAALALVGSGEPAVRVRQAGPPELSRLAQGLNAMAERLDAAQARNLRLNEQLLALQEEERTDLARDLHDEVGPFLFAVSLETAAIQRAVATRQFGELPDRAHAIREAVGHMQRHVRAMLHRLRSANPVEAGLDEALGNLVSFWRARRPGICFVLTVSVDEDALGDPTMAAIYRLVQEGLNNAVRHGRPDRVEVAVAAGDAGQVVVHVADNGSGMAESSDPGLGITGMRERVAALGGSLHIDARDQGTGLVVTARLPCGVAMEDA